MTTEHETHQDDKSDEPDRDDARGYRLGHTPERDGEARQSQCRGGEKEHDGIYGQQEEDTVVQQRRPEPGTLIVTAIKEITDDQGQHSHAHQPHGPKPVPAGYYKMFFYG